MLAMALCSYGGCVKKHERVNAFNLVMCFVPHGSVLSPRMFIVNAADLADIAKEHCHNPLIRRRHAVVSALQS